jgi:hypothetical protein
VSGDFKEAGLTDDLDGLSHQDYIGLEEWLKFYHKDYKYVGKLVGRFYQSDGQVKKFYHKYVLPQSFTTNMLASSLDGSTSRMDR